MKVKRNSCQVVVNDDGGIEFRCKNCLECSKGIFEKQLLSQNFDDWDYVCVFHNQRICKHKHAQSNALSALTKRLLKKKKILDKEFRKN